MARNRPAATEMPAQSFNFSLFMFAVIMMLRDDVLALDEDGQGHGHG